MMNHICFLYHSTTYTVHTIRLPILNSHIGGGAGHHAKKKKKNQRSFWSTSSRFRDHQSKRKKCIQANVTLGSKSMQISSLVLSRTKIVLNKNLFWRVLINNKPEQQLNIRKEISPPNIWKKSSEMYKYTCLFSRKLEATNIQIEGYQLKNI